MAERATVFQTTQIGVEATPGVAVPITKRLLATSFTPTPVVPLTPFEPMGFKSPTDLVREKEHTEATIKGQISYNDMVYLFSGHFTQAVISTPSGATLTRRWVFTPVVTGPDSPSTYTIESGSVAGAESFSFGLMTDFSIRITQTEATTAGKFVGQALNENITLGTGPNATYTVNLGGATSGTFTLTVGGNTTAGQSFNVTAAALQTALTGLVSVGANNATVTGNPGGPYTITFVGTLSSTPVVLTANGASLVGGTGLVLTSIQTGAARVDVPSMVADPAQSTVWVGNALTNQVSTITLNGSPTGGTFAVSIVHPFTGKTVTTSTLAFNASSATVQTAFDAAFGTGNTTVSGSAGGPYTVTFQNAFASIAVTVSADGSLLTGAGVTSAAATVATPAGLTQLIRLYEFTLDSTNRFTPEYTLDSTNSTFSNYVERSFDLKAQIILQHNSVSAGLMADLRVKNEKFMKVVFWGTTIESGAGLLYNNRIDFTFPFKFDNPSRGDHNDVWTGTYGLVPIYDSAFGGVIKATVDNALTAL